MYYLNTYKAKYMFSMAVYLSNLINRLSNRFLFKNIIKHNINLMIQALYFDCR